jgi:hypothetical protein
MKIRTSFSINGKFNFSTTTNKFKCSESFKTQLNASNKLNTKLHRNTDELTQVRNSYQTSINEKFYELMKDGKDLYLINKNLYEFLEWNLTLFGYRSLTHLSFPCLDKIFNNKEFTDEIINKGSNYRLFNFLPLIRYRHLNLLESSHNKLLNDKFKIKHIDVGNILPYFNHCCYKKNDEIFCENIAKSFIIRKNSLNYNSLLFGLNSFSKFNHTPDYLWKDMEQYFLMLIKRLYKPISLLRLVDSFEEIQSKNDITFSNIWIVVRNFIENNEKFFNKGDSVNYIIYSICKKNAGLSESLSEELTSQMINKNHFSNISILCKTLDTANKNIVIERYQEFLNGFDSFKEVQKIHQMISTLSNDKIYNPNFMKNCVLNNPYFLLNDFELYFMNYQMYLNSMLFLISQDSLASKVFDKMKFELNSYRIFEKLICTSFHLFSLREIKNVPVIHIKILESCLSNFFNNIIIAPNQFKTEIKLFILLSPFLKGSYLGNDIIKKSKDVFKPMNTEDDVVIRYLLSNNFEEIDEKIDSLILDIEKTVLLKTIKDDLDLTFKDLKKFYKIKFFSSKFD